jgi:hypothetical protein
MDLDTLYKIYGQLMINNEILQSQINQVKKQIADALNAQPATPPALPASAPTPDATPTEGA